MVGPNRFNRYGSAAEPNPNPPELTRWGDGRPAAVKKERIVDEAVERLNKGKQKCPDCSFKTGSTKRYDAHVGGECKRQRKLYEEREKAEKKGGVTEERFEEFKGEILDLIKAALKPKPRKRAPRKKKAAEKK